MEERVLKILNEINESIVSFEGDNLFDEGILDSLEIVDLIERLEDEFDIEIDAELVVEENFKNKEAIIALIEGLVG